MCFRCSNGLKYWKNRRVILGRHRRVKHTSVGASEEFSAESYSSDDLVIGSSSESNPTHIGRCLSDNPSYRPAIGDFFGRLIYRPQSYGHRPSTGECLADISDIVRSPDRHREMTDQRPFSVPGCIKGARSASGVFPVLEVRQSCTRILHFCEFFMDFFTSFVMHRA